MESGAFERTQTPQPKWLLDPKQSHGLIPGYVLATGAPCCMDRRCGRTEPDPCSGLCDADVLRASEVQHTVQHVGGDRHFARLTPVRLEAQPITDDALPARHISLRQGAPVVSRHPLPAYAAALGDTSE